MIRDLLDRLGIAETNSGVFCRQWREPRGTEIESVNPATNKPLARVATAAEDDYELVAESAQAAFLELRKTPAPARGEFIRQLGIALREHKRDLGLLVTLETGKILSEGEGEVQEMIDMCDFATGLSRQLYGLTIASERSEHRMLEQWHPLGPVGIITAFNFPVAVWAWNATVATVCGDSSVWKPSPLAPLTAIAVQQLANRVAKDSGWEGMLGLCIGEGHAAGQWLCEDRRFPLISATGSCRMGRSVGQTVAARLGRTLLELGGNNAVVLTPSADQALALRAVVFAAVGTSGQRCTTLRRLIIHESIADRFAANLVAAYQSVKIGDPWEDGVLMGPLINQQAVQTMMAAVESARQQGGKVLCGGNPIDAREISSSPRSSRLCRTCRSRPRRHSLRSCTSSVTRRWTKHWRSTTPWTKVYRRPFLRIASRKPSGSCPRRVAIAGLPM